IRVEGADLEIGYRLPPQYRVHAVGAIAFEHHALSVAHPQPDVIAYERVPRDPVRVAARVMMLGIAPFRLLNRIRPQADRGGSAVEQITVNGVVLAVLDRDPRAVPAKVVRRDPRPKAVAAPHAVLAAPRAIADDVVAAERDLDPVRRGVADVVAGERVVVRTARPGIHGGLARPQEDPITAVRHRVEGHVVARALLEQQEIGR